MDGTFTQCFPRHLQELFARTYITSLILTLSQVSCGGDVLPYRLWKKGNTILGAGNAQKISDIGAFSCTEGMVCAWAGGAGSGRTVSSGAVFSGQCGFCHIQAHVFGRIMGSVCCPISWESISLYRFGWFYSGITKGSSLPATFTEDFIPVVLKCRQKYINALFFYIKHLATVTTQ